MKITNKLMLLFILGLFTLSGYSQTPNGSDDPKAAQKSSRRRLESSSRPTTRKLRGMRSALQTIPLGKAIRFLSFCSAKR